MLQRCCKDAFPYTRINTGVFPKNKDAARFFTVAYQEPIDTLIAMVHTIHIFVLPIGENMRVIPPPPKSLIVAWLKRRLSDGPVRSDDLFREAKELDVSPSRLRSASKSIGVVIWKEGYQGKWWWGLPAEGPSSLERVLAENIHPDVMKKFTFPDRPSMFNGMRLSDKAEE